MNVKDVKKETAKNLGVPESDLDYITEEFLAEIEANPGDEDSEMDSDAEGVMAVGKWGRYGNRVTFSGDKVHYYRGPRPGEPGGSSNYGCGNLKKWVKKSTARYIKVVGQCGGSKGAKKLLSNYRT